MYRIAFFLLTLFLSVTNLYAQLVPQTSNFMFNQLVYNPAAAGMHETDFNANLISRFQWGGFGNGGPTTNLFWTDYRFGSKKTAVGLNLNFDKFGATSEMQAAANYAYLLPLSTKNKLSFGLRAGIVSAKLDTRDLKAWDANDPILGMADYRTVYPIIGTGVQLNGKNYYAGISLPDLYKSDKYNFYGDKDASFFQMKRNFIFMSGYKWKLNDTYSLCPNLKMMYYTGGTLRADINAILEITDYFWAGITYATTKNYSLMAGTHISSRVRFAYAYEINARSKVGNKMSTHEINLMLNLDNLFRK